MKWYPCFLILLAFCLILPSSFKCAVSVNNTVKCISKEREALLDLNHGLNTRFCLASTWGKDQENEQSDCCKWLGVGCDSQTGHVISLDLSYCNDGIGLQGNISSSLAELEHLKSLDLSYNYLSQKIPSFIGSFVDLQYLNLSGYFLYGKIPHQLSNLSRLTSLDLSSFDDDTYGSLYVDNLEWLSRLTLLRDIDLSSVDLSKATNWLQIVTGFPFLRNLRLSFCSLAPTIPSSPSHKNSSTTLSVVDLSHNSLSDSSILKWMSNLTGISTSLKHLNLHHNGMTGTIPDVVGNIHSLSYLDLSFNALEGVVPASIFNLTLLEYLDVSYNKLQEIQTWNSSRRLCKLETLYLRRNNISSKFSSLLRGFSGCVHKALGYLDASENHFWGSIPNEIATFPSLKMLDLGDNQLNGTISSSLRLLSVLEWLDLHSNSLNGKFSNHHLSNLSKLSHLDLSDNPELAVYIPDNWVPPFQLDLLWLSSCKLGPQFPKWVQTQTKLQFLDISSTGIFDTIPAAFWNILSSHLSSLNLSHNEIYGVLPYPSRNSAFDFEHHASAVTVDLSWNHMEGAIPSFLGHFAELYLNNNNFSGSIAFLCHTQSYLKALDASNNFFSGKLPDCWENFQYLEFLSLDHNNFTGKLPLSIGNLSQLKWLSMRNNRFHGDLQMLSSKKLTSLDVLDLGYNSFTGHIPEGIWAEGIVVLDLRKNKLSGRLPLSLCKMAELSVLDLSLNQLSGTLPECICNLKAMTYSADFGHVYPIWLGNKSWTEMIMWKRKEQSFSANLALLRSIAISDNKLEGHIPNGISCLKGLISLDLARNQLAGSIPPKIGELTSLELLDLSSNHLSGQIPSSLANLNFLAILNFSNNKLSGRIPMGTQIQSMDPTSYMGNPGLCGAPLPKCSNDPTTVSNIPKGPSMTPDEEENNGKKIHLGLYISVVVGFIVGFWGVCGTLVIKRSWRHAYFWVVEEIYDRIYVMVAVTTARVWKRQ